MRFDKNRTWGQSGTWSCARLEVLRWVVVGGTGSSTSSASLLVSAESTLCISGLSNTCSPFQQVMAQLVTSSIGQHRRHAVHLRLGQHLLTGTRTQSSRGKIRNCLLSLQLFSHLSYETYESATLTSRTALWSLSLRTLFGHSHLSHYLASLTFLYYSHTLTSCTCQLSHSLARVSKHIAG